MSNTQAKIDSNRARVAIAVDNSGNTLPLKVDSVTGRLLISITKVSDTAPVLTDNSKIDNNRIRTCLVTDETNKRPLLIENTTGLLFCDVNVE